MKYILGILIFFPFLLYSQTDPVGPGRAVYFDGFTESQIDMGDVHNSMTFPFSISMWVYLDEDKNSIASIFSSEEGSSDYRGFWVRVTPTNIGIGWGDGTGGNYESFRRVKVATVSDISGKWVHLAFVAKAKNEIYIYLNGILQSSFWTGSSTLTMNNDGGDHMRIGRMYTNGEIWRMKGFLDELRLWNYARTQTEIRNDMCRKLPETTTGLIGYWNLDESAGQIAHDKSGNNTHGTRIGLFDYPFSGAPIGDVSIPVYPATPDISLGHQDDTVTVTSISSDALGYHIYKAYTNELPCGPGYYFGVFSFSNDISAPQIQINYKTESDSVQNRLNNSYRDWNVKELPADRNLFFTRRQEFSNMQPWVIDLGPDLELCEGVPYELSSPDLTAHSYLWSDGSSVENFVITDEVIVWLEMENECGIARDSIEISYQSAPSIGFERLNYYCNELPVEIHLPEGEGYTYQWSVDNTGNSIILDQPGNVDFSISNSCGTVTERLHVNSLGPFKPIPNVITPNSDGLNERFIIDPILNGSALSVYNRWGKAVYNNVMYDNTWNGAELSPGVYFYKIVNPCLDSPLTGYVQILH